MAAKSIAQETYEILGVNYESQNNPPPPEQFTEYIDRKSHDMGIDEVSQVSALEQAFERGEVRSAFNEMFGLPQVPGYHDDQVEEVIDDIPEEQPRKRGRPKKVHSAEASPKPSAIKTPSGKQRAREKSIMKRKIRAYFEHFPEETREIPCPSPNASIKEMQDIVDEIQESLRTGNEFEVLRRVTIEGAKLIEKLAPLAGPYLPEEIPEGFCNLQSPVALHKVMEATLKEGEGERALREIAIDYTGYFDTGPYTRLIAAFGQAIVLTAGANNTIGTPQVPIPTTESSKEDEKKQKAKSVSFDELRSARTGV